MKRLLFTVPLLAIFIPAVLAIGPVLFDYRKSPDLLLPEAYAIAIDALGKTNGYYCYSARLRGERGLLFGGMESTTEGVSVSTSTSGVWHLYFHNTNGSPPSITNGVCVEVGASKPPKIMTYYQALMLERD